MSRLKLFLENFIIYGLGGITGKLIPFILLPVVTRLMPNSYYLGINDIYTVIVSFGGSIAIMGMYDAMFRLFFDSEEEIYRKEICSTAMIFVVIISTIILIIFLLNLTFLSKSFWKEAQYKNLVFLAGFNIFFTAINGIVSAPTRMNNQRKVFLLNNFILPLIFYGGGVILLIKGYFVLALPLSSAIASLIMVIMFSILNRKWFSIKYINAKYLIPLWKIALPLFPNFLVYWIFSSCDRLMIIQMMGANYAGVYAVGAKFGHMSQLIYSAFAGGWQYFAFSTMQDKDQIELTSKVFEYLAAITCEAVILCTLFAKPVLELLFEEEYYAGVQLVPYLFFAPLLLMLYQTISNQFIVIKKTWPNIGILCIGATVNVILNYFLINLFGIEGAALGTVLGYISAITICLIVLIKMKLLQIRYRFIWLNLSILLDLIVWRAAYEREQIINTVCGLLCFFFVAWLYRQELQNLLLIIKRKKRDL